MRPRGRDARAIAALNHTNICDLYDVGPDDYLVMELVEGESLQGPMSFDEALPILNQLVDGIRPPTSATSSTATSSLPTSKPARRRRQDSRRRSRQGVGAGGERPR